MRVGSPLYRKMRKKENTPFFFLPPRGAHSVFWHHYFIHTIKQRVVWIRCPGSMPRAASLGPGASPLNPCRFKFLYGKNERVRKDIFYYPFHLYKCMVLSECKLTRCEQTALFTYSATPRAAEELSTVMGMWMQKTGTFGPASKRLPKKEARLTNKHIQCTVLSVTPTPPLQTKSMGGQG